MDTEYPVSNWTNIRQNKHLVFQKNLNQRLNWNAMQIFFFFFTLRTKNNVLYVRLYRYNNNTFVRWICLQQKISWSIFFTKNDQDFLIFSLVVNFYLSLGIGSVIKQSVPEDMDMDDDLDDPNEVNTLL